MSGPTDWRYVTSSRKSRVYTGAGQRRRFVIALTGVAVLLMLAACAAGPNPVAGQGADVAGFWLGLWHGFIAPIAFLVSLVNDTVGIYEVHNNGGWYNLGFLIGVSAFFSGGPAGARGRSRSSKRTR